MDGFEVIETQAANVKLLSLANVSLYQTNLSGINGTFYAIGGREIYGVAVQDNKPLHVNAHVTNFDGIKRGTIYFDGNACGFRRVYNALSEINSRLVWAISGVSMYPFYDPKEEGFVGAYADVLRRTNHTAIGCKGDRVYLIVARNLTLDEFRKRLLNSRLAFDALIALDGGGSTQMRYGGKDIVKSVRVLNHAAVLKEV